MHTSEVYSLLCHCCSSFSAAAAADVANMTFLSPPEDCPDWSCICKDQPAGAMLPAPDNECAAYITCYADGVGSKSICAVAGTGFNPETRLCETLAPPAGDGDMLCRFAKDTSIAPPADGKEHV
jgi:hypothetical protein